MFSLLKFGIKMFSMKKYGHIMHSNIDKIISIYAANMKNVAHGSNQSPRSLLLHKFATITEILLKCGLTVYIFAGCFYFLNPIYLYSTKKEIVPILPLYMPFIDVTTKSGYILLVAIHLGFLFIAVFGSACTDLMFAVVAANIFIPANIFDDNVRELNELLTAKKVKLQFVKAKLMNIILIHREIY